MHVITVRHYRINLDQVNYVMSGTGKDRRVDPAKEVPIVHIYFGGTGEGTSLGLSGEDALSFIRQVDAIDQTMRPIGQEG